ncbi:MAG: EF-P lysine aminoacylase GenX, partial [Thiohalophilus sp.]
LDRQRRIAQGRPAPAIDEKFLAALEYGLPDCAGVALGLDRLLMIATGLDDIRQVLSFSADRL